MGPYPLNAHPVSDFRQGSPRAEEGRQQMPWPLPRAVQCCGDHSDTDSEALGRRKAGSKCPGPCPTRYTAREITVTGQYESTLRRGSNLRGHHFTGQRNVVSRSYVCSTILLVHFEGEEMLEKERCSCEAIGIFVRYGSLRLSFMALLCKVDSKTRPVSHTEFHDKTPEMVVNLTRSDTQEEALKDGF